MTVEELLRKQANDVGGQLHRVVLNLSAEDADKQAIPAMMTAREQVEHLCEAYHAVKVSAGGGKHEWGSYSSGTDSWASLMSHFETLRTEAIEAAFAGQNGAELVSDYIVGHDNYHVGQLVSLRLTIDSGWNSYAIYG